jgi:general secretion pathway protein L
MHWLEWAKTHGIGQASIVPSALLLPAPDNGFVRGPVGGTEVVRGPDTAFEGDEEVAALIIGDAPVTSQFVLEDHAVRHSYHHLAKLRTALKS